MLPAGSTGSGVSAIVTARSADGVATVVVVVAVSLPGVGSAVAEPTVAVSVITVPPAVPESTFTTRVNTSLAEAATLGLLQLTVPVAPTAGVVQLHPPGEVSEVNVVLA